MGLSPGTMASMLQNGIGVHDIWLLVQDSPQYCSFLEFKGKTEGGIGGDGDEAAGYDTSEICILSASSTNVSNTKEAWEWQRHFPDWHNEFSIGAYIMELHRKTTVFLSETVYVVSSFIACSLCAKEKVKILQLKKIWWEYKNEIATIMRSVWS